MHSRRVAETRPSGGAADAIAVLRAVGAVLLRERADGAVSGVDQFGDSTAI